LKASSVNWFPDNQGMANVRVDMIRYRSSDQTFLAATHGRGLFVAQRNQTSSRTIFKDDHSYLHIWPNPGQGIFNITLPNFETGELTISDGTGNIVLERKLVKKIPGSVLRIDLSMHSSGIYLLSLHTRYHKYSGRVIIKH